ncbi:hypothetical protein BOX15_Mlig026487g1 [Macrostomum lignano]|uniref:Uncharacterized protein n=1 Tax=Macrostomum lignano TaxID=282301 RepID=A0A267FD05_9PLAT|nr:hypothetical protein BOX15_Mlig026487g1 [Macrostomum lignano]
MDSIVYKNDSTGPHSLLQEKWQYHSRQSEHTEKCPRLLLDDGVKRQRCFVCGIELASEKYVEHIQSAAHRINLQRLGGGGDGAHTNAKDDAEKAEMSSAVAEYHSSGGYRGYNDNDFEARNAEGEAEYYGSLWKTAKSLPPPPPPPPPPMLEHPRTDALLAEALAQLARLRAERAGRGEKAERNARSFSWRYRNELEAEVEPVEAAESSRSNDDRSSNRRRRQRERCDSATETETLIVTPLETCRTDATGAELLLHRSARDVPSQETTMRQTRDAAVATETDLETATSSAATKQLSVPAAVEVKEEKPTADRFDFASQMPTPRLAASTDSEVAAINGLADAAVQKEAEEEAEVSDRTASPLPHRSREVERMQAALELSLQADQVDDVIGEVDDRIADLRRQVEALNEQIAAEEAVREELQQKRLEILQRRVDVLRGCFELPVLNGGEPSSARFARDDFCETENAASPSPPPPPQQQQQSFPADFETDAETGQSGSEVQRQSLVHRVLLDDSEASAANGGGPLAVDSPRDADLIQQTLDRLSALSQPPPPPSKQVQQGRRRPRKQCQPAEPELPPAEVLSDVLSAAPREPPSRPASAAALAGDDGKARISRRTASETRLPIDEACAGRGSSNVNNSTSHRRPRRRRVSSGRSSATIRRSRRLCVSICTPRAAAARLRQTPMLKAPPIVRRSGQSDWTLIQELQYSAPSVTTGCSTPARLAAPALFSAWQRGDVWPTFTAETTSAMVAAAAVAAAASSVWHCATACQIDCSPALRTASCRFTTLEAAAAWPSGVCRRSLAQPGPATAGFTWAWPAAGWPPAIWRHRRSRLF